MSDQVKHNDQMSGCERPFDEFAPVFTEAQAKTVVRLVCGFGAATILAAAAFVVLYAGPAMLVTLGLVALLFARPAFRAGVWNLVREDRPTREFPKAQTLDQLSQITSRPRSVEASHAHAQYLEGLKEHGWLPGSGEPVSYLYMRRRRN